MLGRGDVDADFVEVAAVVELDFVPGGRMVSAEEGVGLRGGGVRTARFEEVGEWGAVIEEAGGAFVEGGRGREGGVLVRRRDRIGEGDG